MIRCNWCENDLLYMKYHDEEWGIPVHTDKKHFEFLVLESAQAGLSWITILRKRENYRKAYDGFDFTKVAQYGDKKVIELIQNEGIVRNKLKIAASINNAVMFLKIQEEFGSFDSYIWEFVGNKPLINQWDSIVNVPATSDLSDKVTKDLKKRGFKFLGSTIIYAYLQATGIINDHIKNCFRYNGDLIIKSE